MLCIVLYIMYYLLSPSSLQTSLLTSQTTTMQLSLQAPLLLLVLAWCQLAAAFRAKDGRCERITIPMCMDMRYNLTRMPNLVGHRTQKDAAAQVHEFIPLVQLGTTRSPPRSSFFYPVCLAFQHFC